ncbi:MAG: Ribokinase, partial [uncultured Solirubrobacteraceae bacterium]
EPHRRRVPRLRRRQDSLRGARAHARRRRHPLRPRRVVLRRGPRRGPRRGGLRRGVVGDPAHPGHRHGRRGAGARRQDVLLVGRLRRRPEQPRDARDGAQRLRDLRAQALRGLPGLRRALPGQHPARPAARRARAVHPGALRGDGLHGPLDQHRARVARAHDPRRGLPAPQRRGARAAHGQAEHAPGRRGAPELGPAGRGGQAGQVRSGALHAGRALRAARLPAARGGRPDGRRGHVRGGLRRLRGGVGRRGHARGADERDGPRHGPGLLQRGGLRDGADAAAHPRGDPRARRAPRAHHPLRRPARGAAGL